MKYPVFIYSFLIFLQNCESRQSSTLQLVHVYFRHGSRTPELKAIYPTDPYGIETFKPMGLGALTNGGKDMCYRLGQRFRGKYNTFLGDIYTSDIVEATSTDYDRTKMSLLLVLAGLFPPAPSQVWNKNVTWLPIPYNYTKYHLDYCLRRPQYYCPAYAKEADRVWASEEINNQLKKYQELFRYIEKHANKSMKTYLDGFRMYQTLNAEDSMNLSLPEWAKAIYPEKIHAVAGEKCLYENITPVLKRLGGGRHWACIIKRMVEKSKGTLSPSGRKIYLYSGHEHTVQILPAALNMFHPHVPKYTSATIVELHRTGEGADDYAVKIYYLPDADSEPQEQILPGCEALCPLKDFIRITEPYVPVNYTAECQSNVDLGSC